jgi:hypothetical protein
MKEKHPHGFKPDGSGFVSEPVFDDYDGTGEDRALLESLASSLRDRMHENGVNGTFPGTSYSNFTMINSDTVKLSVDIEGDDDSDIFESYEFILERVSKHSVVYRAEDMEVYGPYADFYELDGSICAWIDNELDKII